MKLIKSSFEILEQESGFVGIMKHIERCGRTAYKSEDKITEDSWDKFVNKIIIPRDHTAVLEHGTVYLKVSINEWNTLLGNHYEDYINNPYSFVNVDDKFYYITTNYRVLLQNNWLDDLKYQCDPTEYHLKRISVKFICDRGVSHEFIRHRLFSFIQESTRYCNYSKDKFGNELTFIVPNWIDIPKEVLNINNVEYWELRNGEGFGHIGNLSKKIDLPISKETCRYLDTLKQSERSYFQLLQLGWKPQQARAVLPNSLKTELIMTGTTNQWHEFFKLRCASDAHPQAQELAIPLREEFIKRGYLKW